MADTFITKLTEVATPTKDDLAIVVDNPTSTPSNKKVTLQNLANNISRFVNTITTNEDDTDIVFKQYVATEVARIHDGKQIVQHHLELVHQHYKVQHQRGVLDFVDQFIL